MAIKRGGCEFDGYKYRCPWDIFVQILEDRSLPKGVEVDDICFTHLENRIRPVIIETNMPWWLASAIAIPLVVLSLYILKRWKAKRDLLKSQQESQQ